MAKNGELIKNIFDQPAYSIKEAARYLGIPCATLRDWVKGFPRSRQEAVIFLPEPNLSFLSFTNLVEVYVLDAIRRKHGISFPKVRKALNYLRIKYPSKHPLAENSFETDGLDIFVEKYGSLISISQEGQVAMKEIIGKYLKRIERDAHGAPIKLYPFISKRSLDEPKRIMIDPRVSFGKPVLVDTGIPTCVIFERFIAGDSVEGIANDYCVGQEKVEDAIRCEQESKAA